MFEKYGVLLVNFKWKHDYCLLLGRNHLNIFIFYVAFRIYKRKLLCRLESLGETAYKFYYNVKKSIYFYS